MPRYIDADALKENHLMSDDCNNCEQNPRECQFNYIHTKMDFCEWIDDEPTADVVEVVRCKDCTRQMICFHSDDYFCADGERREDDKG